MTSEQFVARYNRTAAENYFAHRIVLDKSIPRRILRRNQHRVAGGGSISFMLTEEVGHVRDITMFDTKAAVEGHKQLQSIAASILVDILVGPSKEERKAVIERLGLPNGQYGRVVQVGKGYFARSHLLYKSPCSSLVVEFRFIRREKGVTAFAADAG